MYRSHPTHARIQAEIERNGSEAALQYLAKHFRAEHRFHELFEVRKLQIRQRMGLPWQFTDTGHLAEHQRRRMEEQLLQACREVGTLLIEDGQLRAGWMYMQPVGEPATMRSLLQRCQVNDENADDLIEIALADGNAPELGLRIVLDRYGTCNAITTYESCMNGQSMAVRRPVAEMLVDHLYQELHGNVRSHLQKLSPGESDPATRTLRELVTSCPAIFDAGGHHIDTSHLAAVVRLARIVQNRQCLQQALQLAEYGTRLAAEFQLADDPPFDELYAHTVQYLAMLLGDGDDTQLEEIRRRARSADRDRFGNGPIEWLVYLLDQRGRTAEAVEHLVHDARPDAPPAGIAPSLLDLCQKLGNWDPALAYYERQEDLLNYSIACLLRRQSNPGMRSGP